jgi:hypothetical protein
MRRRLFALAVVLVLIAPSISAATTPESPAQLQAENKVLTDQLARQKKLTRAQTKRANDYRLKYLSLKTWWTEGDIRFVATMAADKYHFKGALRTWAIGACVHTAKREADKKYADKTHKRYLYSTHSVKRSGRCGLHQWGREWAGSKAQKTDGVWSCNRWMRVLRDGGKAKIIQHWRATIGYWRYQ